MTLVHDSTHYWRPHLLVRGVLGGSARIIPPLGWPSLTLSVGTRLGLNGSRWGSVSSRSTVPTNNDNGDFQVKVREGFL